MSDSKYDVVVIGGGPGGYVTAIRSAQLGMKTALVEREHLGGVCLNWGCIPTKALLRCAELLRLMKEAGSFGLHAENVRADLAKIVERSRGVSARLRQGVGYLLSKNGVEVLEGSASLDGSGGRVLVETGEGTKAVEARHVILATGARPKEFPGLRADGELVWTYREALVPRELPGRLLIVGAGPIGLEFADFYNQMGSEVTVVEALPQILPAAEPEAARLLRGELERRGITFHTGVQVEGLDKGDGRVTAHLLVGEERLSLTVDRALLALGVVGNVENLGLEKTKVKTERGFIRVDRWLATDEPGVYAIGDVAGPPCLAHKASHEGVICVERIAGHPSVHPMDPRKIPYCTYTTPQVASIGLTEKEAKAAGHALKTGDFPFNANGKAMALGDTTGFVKTIFDAGNGELLGAHMVGAEVTEMIQGYALAMGLETTELELMDTIFAHPTLSEMMHESVLAAFGRAIHI